MSFAPSIILALVIFILFLLGTVSVFLYRCFVSTVSTASGQALQVYNVDLEAASLITPYHASAAPSASTTSRRFWFKFTFSGRPRPAEPELPWPILAVLPSLSPKEPLHRRMPKFLMFWRKSQEVKVRPVPCAQREGPFTVTDVLKAIEQVNDRAAAREDPQVTDIDHAQRTAPANNQGGRRCFVFSMFNRTVFSKAQIPSIVVHPCDGIPYRDNFKPSATPPSLFPSWQARFTVHHTTSTPSSPSSTSSPTMSEPDSPGPVTPALESSTYFSELPRIYTRDCLDVPMPSSTAPRIFDAYEPEEAVSTLSNVSGKHFVLATPPKRNFAAAAPNEEGLNDSQEDLAALCREFAGLFTTQSTVDFREQLPAVDSDIFEDASEEMSTGSPDSSVLHLGSVLNFITSSSSTSFKQLATIPTNLAAHSRTVELSKKYFFRLRTDSEMVDAAAAGDDDWDDEGNVSIASGNTDFYECSAESNLGLGFDIEELYGRREAVECST